MNGNRFLLDTNAIIRLLKGELAHFNSEIQNAEWIGISIISQIEFMAFSNLSNEDIQLFEKFASRIEVVGINPNSDLLAIIYNTRKQAVLKLPDAIIASTAIWKNAILISDDTHFSKQKGLKTLHPN